MLPFRYEQAAEWAGLLGWEVTHFFTDDQADPLIDNIFSCLLDITNSRIMFNDKDMFT